MNSLLLPVYFHFNQKMNTDYNMGYGAKTADK